MYRSLRIRGSLASQPNSETRGYEKLRSAAFRRRDSGGERTCTSSWRLLWLAMSTGLEVEEVQTGFKVTVRTRLRFC